MVSDYKLDWFNKMANSKPVKDIYPMIDHIKINEVPNYIWVAQVYLNDETIDGNNIYSKGLDPHYLVDFHLKKLKNYLSIKDNLKFGFVIFDSNGENIYDFIPS